MEGPSLPGMLNLTWLSLWALPRCKKHVLAGGGGVAVAVADVPAEGHAVDRAPEAGAPSTMCVSERPPRPQSSTAKLSAGVKYICVRRRSPSRGREGSLFLAVVKARSNGVAMTMPPRLVKQLYPGVQTSLPGRSASSAR